MIRPAPAGSRRGYTLTVVFIFLILLCALWSTVYRTTSSVLRIETERVLQQTRDQGAMNALAQAIHPAGISVGMADGSARTFAGKISPQVWWYYCTPAGNEVIQENVD